MREVFEQFQKIGIVPVLALDDASDAEPVARALIEGGLACAEVTFRTDAAQESIRRMAERFPEMLVGAGTVLTADQADQAVSAGAKFIVSPGFNPKVVSHCLKRQIPVIPGCANPSDIEAAMELGLDVVKIFPAEAIGGVAAIKAMAAPYPKLRFMPTGGIHAGNVKRYLEFEKIIACGGSWMVKGDLIREKNWQGVTDLTREAVAAMLGLRLRHIGVNHDGEEAAKEAGRQFSLLFGADLEVKKDSFFAGPSVELMKRKGRGTHGHLAVGAHSVERAVHYLKQRGFSFEEASASYDEKGRLAFIYLEQEISGFAVHLILDQAN